MAEHDTYRCLPIDKLGYAAGLIDGEGSIMVQNRSFIVMCISNCNLDCLKFIHELFGVGNFHQDSFTGCNRILINGQEAVNVLKAVLPYLIVKRELALTVIDWPFVGKGKRVADRDREMRGVIADHVHALNARKTREAHYAEF